MKSSIMLSRRLPISSASKTSTSSLAHSHLHQQISSISCKPRSIHTLQTERSCYVFFPRQHRSNRHIQTTANLNFHQIREKSSASSSKKKIPTLSQLNLKVNENPEGKRSQKEDVKKGGSTIPSSAEFATSYGNLDPKMKLRVAIGFFIFSCIGVWGTYELEKAFPKPQLPSTSEGKMARSRVEILMDKDDAESSGSVMTAAISGK
ncbi:hypothetical protein HDU76_008746 [Blyttiomyces sp. JEL0837]|nr:hypothetical protein HDU76_008746 [Blyttiomyces sp. JEL0837]